MLVEALLLLVLGSADLLITLLCLVTLAWAHYDAAAVKLIRKG